MMDTPICDFVGAYADSEPLRFHMPGHKGRSFLGAERLDITEIDGADVLYHADGIIRRSEENASTLFGTARTLYSTEGSSLCIRAMLYLAMLHAKASGKRPIIAAGRNAHKVFMTAAALLDVEIQWLFPTHPNSVLSCEIDPGTLDKTLSATDEPPAAVYITSPDYLGNLADVRALAAVCHRHGALLLVDNAHGAYLRFLPSSCHPIELGADMCCDSAHKTLPVLTGGAYLHISRNAPKTIGAAAENALALFASTSPSYLILQSLDAANRHLAGDYPTRLADCAKRITALKDRLAAHGYPLIGTEPMKLTIAPKAYGYTGMALARRLAADNIVCEFADPDVVVLMITPESGAAALERLELALMDIPKQAAIAETPPFPARPVRVLSAREALLSPQERLPIRQCGGRVLAAANVSCPPAIPIVVCGERIDESALLCFDYYGIDTCFVVTT